MTSKELLTLLNQALASELQVSVQYVAQHVMWRGVHGFAVQGELMSIAKTEMGHYEKLAERIFYLGENPTTQPATIVVGNSLKEMIEQDIKDEESAITLYKQIVAQATLEQDITTAFIVKQILEDEESHHDTFTTLNEDL